MKKNDWIYLLSVLVFSLLFWKQMPGLNFLIMNIVLIAAVVLKKKDVLKNKNWWFAAIGALASAYCVFWYGDKVSLFTNFASLLLVSAFVIEKENSMLVAFFQSICNVFVTIAYIFIDAIHRKEKSRASGETKSTIGKRTWIVLGALVIVTVFFFLYRGSNVLFYKLTEDINLDFISIGWCLFTLAGAFVLYAFYYYHALPGVSEWDSSHALTLKPSEKESWMDKLMSMPTEKFSAIVLLVLLNLLLLVVNALDGLFIFGGSKLPEGVTYTEYVHQGIGLLITSIVMAMLIILYYFRGRLNFAENSVLLRNLALIWIAQNAFMLVSNMFRNEMYIDAYGLTYKRIGVYIYLLLAVIGLCTTGWKVYFRKTNAFLFRSNSWLFYAVLVLSCFVNWDEQIANHNINRNRSFDGRYIASLSFRAYPALMKYYESHPEEQKPAGLESKLVEFLSRQKYLREENKWQSATIAGRDVYEKLNSLKSFGVDSMLDLRNKGIKKAYYFPQLSNAELLNLSDNDLADVGELGRYKNVKKLFLDDNDDLVSLKGVEGMESLEELSLSNTKVRDYAPLLLLNNLKVLETEKISNSWKAQLEKRFPGIQIREGFSIFNL